MDSGEESIVDQSSQQKSYRQGGGGGVTLKLSVDLNKSLESGEISYITNKTSHQTVKNIYRKLPELRYPMNK
jgi:hypothetical protein